MTFARGTWPVGLAVVIVLSGLVPWSGLVPTAPTQAPVAPPTAPATPAHPAVPHPSITCPPPPYPIYSSQNGILMLTPGQAYQGTCGYINVDEAHAGFASSAPRSGEQWSVPVHLPGDGNQTQGNAYSEFWVGMVVAGDRFSEWGQSYAGVFFVPSGQGASLTYRASVHILALEPALVYPSGVCPFTNLTWNGSFECETDLWGVTTAGSPGTTLSPGDQLDVAFAGDRTAGSAMTIWLNDSTTPGNSLSWVLNATNTGTYSFHPYFNASCPDTCVLNWSMNVGLGPGFMLCPNGPIAFAVCDSYNSTIWGGTGPPEFGIPHFLSGGSLSGDYYYLAPVSDSGVCNFNAPLGQVSTCYNNDVFGGNGFYPFFSYNGSQLDFGINWTWTTQDWGGAVTEYRSVATINDIVPMYFYRIGNDSREGFIANGRALNVTATVQDLGSVTSVDVNYQINSGSVTVLPMALVSGTAHDGSYSAEIPVGANGWVNYTITAVNHAGASIVAPFSGSYHVQRGPLPTFSVLVLVPFPPCASTWIGGVQYVNNSTAFIQPGDYALFGQGCYPYVFQRWTITRGLSVVGATAVTATLGISTSGTVSASWKYVRPIDTLVAHTNPTSCGQVVFNGSFLSDGQSPAFPVYDGLNYSLGFVGCGGMSFAGFTYTGNYTILGGSGGVWNAVPHANGTITANFVLTTSANSVIFYTNPATCGGVAISGVGYQSGTSLSLAAGSYPIAPDPCYHYGFRPPWVTTGGLSISGSTLTVTNGGTITENYYVLTIVLVQISGCGNAYWDSVQVHNNDQLTVANNSTHVVTATACPGWYLFAISGLLGVNVVGNVATVNASGTIQFTFIRGTNTQVIAFLTDPSTCGAIVFNSVPFVNSNFTYVTPGTVATVSAIPCGGYGFLHWTTFGEVQILGSTAWLNGSGAIEANFQPIATLYLFTSPSSCGSVSVANTTYPTGATLDLTEFKTYPVVPNPCTGYGFNHWVNSSGAQLPLGTSVASQNLFLSSAATLTAIFTPITYSVTITVVPANCGGVRISGQVVTNGTVLTMSNGTFVIAAAPCTGNHLVRWTTSANVSVVNTTLWVNGSGSLQALYEPVPPSVVLTVASSSFAGTPVPFGAVVAVPVPPYNYTYLWTFGDGGAPSTTPVNFTSHTYATAGSYVVNLTVTDPYGRLAYAEATISVVPASGSSVTGLPTTTLIALGAAIVVLLAVLVLGSWLRRGPRTPPPTDSAPMPAPEPPAATEPAPDVEPPKP